MINAIKAVSKIPDDMDLIAPAVLEPILEVKNKTSNFKESYLKIGEVLIALSKCWIFFYINCPRSGKIGHQTVTIWRVDDMSG